jgi:hypothetical protein
MVRQQYSVSPVLQCYLAYSSSCVCDEITLTQKYLSCFSSFGYFSVSFMRSLIWCSTLFCLISKLLIGLLCGQPPPILISLCYTDYQILMFFLTSSFLKGMSPILDMFTKLWKVTVSLRCVLCNIPEEHQSLVLVVEVRNHEYQLLRGCLFLPLSVSLSLSLSVHVEQLGSDWTDVY